jgi:hypothetical protein
VPEYPDDKEIDAALERMAWLLGPEFVAECEKEIIKENPVGKRRSTATQPPADQPGAGKRV